MIDFGLAEFDEMYAADEGADEDQDLQDSEKPSAWYMAPVLCLSAVPEAIHRRAWKGKGDQLFSYLYSFVFISLRNYLTGVLMVEKLDMSIGVECDVQQSVCQTDAQQSVCLTWETSENQPPVCWTLPYRSPPLDMIMYCQHSDDVEAVT